MMLNSRKLLWLLILISQRFVSEISELCDVLKHQTRHGGFQGYWRCNAPFEFILCYFFILNHYSLGLAVSLYGAEKNGLRY